MGTPMARRLVDSGFQLAVFDRLAERTHSLVEFEARGADSPRDACQDAEVLIIMVMTASQVEDVLFGDNGVAEALAPRAVVVVMSTIGPDAVRELAERLTAQELRVLDAPVSGGLLVRSRATYSLWPEGSEIYSKNSDRFWKLWGLALCIAENRWAMGRP